MSGTTPPPPPPTSLPPPPRRGLRRLNRRPLYLTVCIVALVVGAGAYVLHGGIGSGPKVSDVVGNTQEGNAAEVLSHAPDNFIPAAITLPAVPPTTQAVQVQAPPSRPVSTETDMEIEVRRKAWDDYIKQRNEQHTRLVTQAAAGITGDTIPISSSTAGNGQNGEGQGAGAPGWTTQQTQQNQQKGDFWGQRQDADYQPYTVTDPVSPYEVKAGDVIEAVLISGLNSDTKGLIKAQVTKNVLDHATGTHILIPQGSTLIGAYNTDVAYGQQRLEAGFDRVIFPPPGDESLRLVRTPGSDLEGYAGFHDITENHIGTILKYALLGTAFSVGFQLSQPAQSSFSAYSPGQIAAGAFGQQMNSVTQDFVRRGLNIPPTQVIRNGYHFTVLVRQDIAFEHPWQPTPLPAEGPTRLVDDQP